MSGSVSHRHPTPPPSAVLGYCRLPLANQASACILKTFWSKELKKTPGTHNWSCAPSRWLVFQSRHPYFYCRPSAKKQKGLQTNVWQNRLLTPQSCILQWMKNSPLLVCGYSRIPKLVRLKETRKQLWDAELRQEATMSPADAKVILMKCILSFLPTFSGRNFTSILSIASNSEVLNPLKIKSCCVEPKRRSHHRS